MGEISSDTALKSRLEGVKQAQAARGPALAKPAPKTDARPPTKTLIKPLAKAPTKSRVLVSSADDAAVRRLKEARKREREALDAKNPKKTAKTGAKRASTRPPVLRTKAAAKPSTSPPIRSSVASKRVAPPTATTGPKLSFSQLMKHAESIDTSKLALVAVKKPVSRDPQPSKSLQRIKGVQKGVRESPRPKAGAQHKPNDVSRVPKFAKPSAELMKRIEAKKRLEKAKEAQRGQRGQQRKSHAITGKSKSDAFGIDAQDDSDDEDLYAYGNYADYSDDDGFIVDDGGQYHDWAEADDTDDMEATGAEILEEEEMALKQARLDDRREQMLLEKHAAEKRRRLGM